MLNATGQPGFASTIAERLAKYTFVIANTGNPPDGVHATSEIHYPPGAAASATLLSQYFIPVPVLVEDVLIPPGEVQVIVGTDHIQMESPKERADEAERLAKSRSRRHQRKAVPSPTTTARISRAFACRGAVLQTPGGDHTSQELLRSLVRRLREQLGRRARFQNRPLMQECHTIGHFLGKTHLVGGQHHRHSAFG